MLTRLLAFARRLRRDEGAATMVEYALMLSLIAAACFAAISLMTNALAGPFQKVTTALAS